MPDATPNAASMAESIPLIRNANHKKPKRYNIFGFNISLFTLPQIVRFISSCIAEEKRVVFASQNMHGIHTYFRNPAFRALHRRCYARIDGMPVVWLARAAGVPARTRHRVAWIDMFWPLMARAERLGWRVFYLGADQSVLDSGVAAIKARHPALDLTTHHGYFDARHDSAENAAVVDRINSVRPDLLIVGMGMPRQETWVLENEKHLSAKVIMTSGACMEVIAGALPTPPRWMGPLCLEWLYRLASTPRRSAYRYLVEPWVTLWLMLRFNIVQRLGGNRLAPSGEEFG